jgi:hypothetical protein
MVPPAITEADTKSCMTVLQTDWMRNTAPPHVDLKESETRNCPVNTRHTNVKMKYQVKSSNTSKVSIACLDFSRLAIKHDDLRSKVQ